MWDLIVSVPDHCLSFYFTVDRSSPGIPKVFFYYRNTLKRLTRIS